jgi:ketosteroid isomerase-like protein
MHVLEASIEFLVCHRIHLCEPPNGIAGNSHHWININAVDILS